AETLLDPGYCVASTTLLGRDDVLYYTARAAFACSAILLNAEASRIAISDNTLRSISIQALRKPATIRLYVKPFKRAAAFILATHRARNSRLRCLRSRYAYCDALITACLATLYTRLLWP